MGEPVDEDIEMLHNTQSISARGAYDFFTENNDFTFYPFAGVSFNRWLRNENPRYEKSFSELLFSSVNLGIGAKYKNFYAEIGSSLPVWSQTDHGQSPLGEIGINWIIGFDWKRLNLGVLYEQIPFRGDAGQPSFQSEEYSMSVGIKF